MTEAPPPPKRARDGEDIAGDALTLQFNVKKAVAGAAAAAFEVALPESATVTDLAAKLAEHEGCETSLITIVSRGVPLKDAAAALKPLAEKEGAGNKVPVVYIVRKPAAPAAAPAAAAAAAAAAPAAPAAPAASGGSSSSAAAPAAAAPAAEKLGRRVLLMLRHGQCCHEGEHDHLKELTQHGHKQAEESARYISQLFAAGKLPAKRALLHSTSRRASETAAKLPSHVQDLEVWNADLLRETDPTNNPFRAEEVFNRLFAAPEAGDSDTLIIVAHNNIILYLLMRAAGVPIERAAQAWNLFHLRHASVTRVDVSSAGNKQVLAIGAAAHISAESMTWKNITGADMSAWKGGGPERHKFGGRMLCLVRQVGGSSASSQQIAAVADHVKSLSGYMMSGKAVVTCTSGAQVTAMAIARKFKSAPQIFPDSISEQPEAAFLQFFAPPEESSRDTVVIVAEDTCLLYWLLRSLGMSPEESQVATSLYSIGPASITLVNLKSDSSTKVITVGDMGHLAISDMPA
eukprot:TRINITY_DN11633_c0_g1_i1.p1 TRINITY_DN11633_c0_g1~~TRINITY_DN11633_c0_g1_i1.p1  ORF type:complete len:518 (+),score=142.92 TRINITY_DN11633_c0_g1_i1:71-1624(+)